MSHGFLNELGKLDYEINLTQLEKINCLPSTFQPALGTGSSHGFADYGARTELGGPCRQHTHSRYLCEFVQSSVRGVDVFLAVENRVGRFTLGQSLWAFLRARHFGLDLHLHLSGLHLCHVIGGHEPLRTICLHHAPPVTIRLVNQRKHLHEQALLLNFQRFPSGEIMPLFSKILR